MFLFLCLHSQVFCVKSFFSFLLCHVICHGLHCAASAPLFRAPPPGTVTVSDSYPPCLPIPAPLYTCAQLQKQAIRRLKIESKSIYLIIASVSVWRRSECKIISELEKEMSKNMEAKLSATTEDGLEVRDIPSKGRGVIVST